MLWPRVRSSSSPPLPATPSGTCSLWRGIGYKHGEPGCCDRAIRPYNCVMRIAAAALLYFAIVFGVDLALGPRSAFSSSRPALGKTIAAVCEAPFLLVAMIAAAYWIPKKMGSDTSLASLAAIGIGALVLRQIADFAVVVGLRGISADEQLRYLTTPPGLIYVALLILFGAMPVVVNTHRRR